MSDRQASLVVATAWCLHRDAFASALGSRFRVVGSAATADDAVQLVTTTRPDVTLAGSSSRAEGAQICAALKARELVSRVVVIGPDGDEDALLEAVHAGADGYHAEGAGLEALVHAVEQVASGHASIPGQMLGGLLRNLISRQREEDAVLDRFGRLSNREREILVLMTEGLDNTSIAERMIVSSHTARTHVQNVLRKLEVHSRLEAVNLVTSFELLQRFPPGQERGI